jgi:uncharacterized protein YjbI with pentapeptide repeats
MVSKIELINKLYSLDNRLVLQAVADLRACGKLCDGSLRGIALCRAELQEADLSGADLANVDFHQANLGAAVLKGTKLMAAKLNRADLQGADLDKANLTNADMYKVNLRGAHNLCDTQLARVNELFGSIMPDGNVYDGRFNLAGDLARAGWAKVHTDDAQDMAGFYGVSLETYLLGQQKAVAVLA